MTDRRSQPRSAQRGEPNLAVLLTWLLPGAGHLYLGRPLFGLVAFVLIEGIYLLGVWLSGGMFLEYLPVEMRGRFAAALTPEVGNLGALFWHIQKFGYGPGHPRAWPATMDLGTTLTAASGVLNLLLMARAHFEARSSKPVPVLRGPASFALFTWICPGLGHVLQGRLLRGVLVFALLVGLFLFGTLLAEGTNLDRERHFYYWAGQFLLGAPAIAVEFLHGHPLVIGEVPYADAGVVIASIAGMLNVMCMLDVYAYGEELVQGRKKQRGHSLEPDASPKSELRAAAQADEVDAEATV